MALTGHPKKGRTKGTSPTFFAVFCHKKINVTGCSSQVSASERSGRATASQWDTCPWPLHWKSVAQNLARGYTHPGTYTGIDKSLVLLLSFLFVLAEKETLLLGKLSVHSSDFPLVTLLTDNDHSS